MNTQKLFIRMEELFVNVSLHQKLSGFGGLVLKDVSPPGLAEKVNTAAFKTALPKATTYLQYERVSPPC